MRNMLLAIVLVGLINHLEGAIGAAIAASKRPDVAFIVWMVGSALAVMLKSRWMRFFIGFDPSTALRRVECLVFAAFAEYVWM